MKIAIEKALPTDLDTVQNLGRFYVYDMSRSCGFKKGWETPSDGLYSCFDLRSYWENPDRHPFVIKVDNELAGFALINKTGSSPDIDWNMGEFFIIAKYQRKGVGRRVAYQIFQQFPGVWEVMQIPENREATSFWTKVIDAYTQGKFQKSQKDIPLPMNHPMIVLRFESIPHSRSSDTYTISYQETVSSHEEAILINGITEEALKTKNLTPITPYAFFLKDAAATIVGGVKGATLYGCLYIDSLWITSDLRHQGWGSKLMKEVENLGKKRNCSFATLTTMDWEALPFYQKLGYAIEYTREGFEKDSKMFFLKKKL